MSNDHGLSVHTADDARPEDTTTSTSPGTKASTSPVGSEPMSKAMYGGVVLEVQCNHADYGKLVRIRSGTNPDTGAGFEHSYAHLNID